MTPQQSHLKLFRGPSPLGPRAAPLGERPVPPEDEEKRSGPDLVFWLVLVVFLAFYCWLLAGLASACPCTGDTSSCRCKSCPCVLSDASPERSPPRQTCALLPWRNQMEQRFQQQKQTPPSAAPQTDPAVIAALNHLADAQNKTLDALIKLHAPYQTIPLGGPPLQQIPLGGPPAQIINLGGQPHVVIPLGGAPKQSIPLGTPPSIAPDSPRPPTPAPAPVPAPSPGPAIPLGPPAPAMPKVTEEPTGHQRYTKVKRAYALYRKEGRIKE